jgi:membrane-bound inhibitor of C-type lysozyme
MRFKDLISLTGLVLCAGGAMAQTDAMPQMAAAPEIFHYVCERGVGIDAVYTGTDAAPAVVIHAEGRLIALSQAVSASGARYAEAAGGSGYEWWTKGDTATLSYFDANYGESVTLFAFCTVAE